MVKRNLGDPKISIVTPSFNQGLFLEETIQSVVNQEYPNLEYIVIDGGSTDGSVDIIKKYADKITTWVSEPDGGQYDAINKGFARSTGDIMAWINSDDLYVNGNLSIVAEIFASFPQVQWITSRFPLIADKDSRFVNCNYNEGFTRKGFFRGENLSPRFKGGQDWIQQESTFWRRSLWEKVGGCVDASLKMAGDFDLWARFYKETELYTVGTPLAGFRVHPLQKTSQIQVYLDEAEQVFYKHGGKPYRQWELMLQTMRKQLPLRIQNMLRNRGFMPHRRMIGARFRGRGWDLYQY
ncbi:MAG: glycosyltransferase family 2 protein [Planctomycetales bacterium]